MKKGFRFLLLGVFTSLTCTSCSGTLFEILFGYSKPIGSNTEKMKLNYTYKDYASNSIYSIDSSPSKGNVNILVVPVWFNESSNYILTNTHKEMVREDIQKSFFGSKEEVGWQSVSSFYKEESSSLLNYQGVVAPWYECQQDGLTIKGDGVKSLVTSSTEWYFSLENALPRSNFDLDNNGYLDAVILVYALPDYDSLESDNETLWAYCQWMQKKDADKDSPKPNAFMWASYDFMYNEANALIKSGAKYGRGDNDHCLLDTHTYIHEMGHVLGLEDYYDYSNQYVPAGGFSMQDMNVGGHDPYSVLALGWSEPYIPVSDCEITLHPFTSSHEVIILSSAFNKALSPFDEYLILELYTPTGLNSFDITHRYKNKYPQGSNKSGIRLWHVDARMFSYRNKKIYSDPSYGNMLFMMSNTYYGEDEHTNNYVSPLGEKYANYNLLQLIRNKISSTYQPKDYLSDELLFTNNTAFSMNLYKRQFVNGEYLNNGKALKWSFSVTIEGSGENTLAHVKLTKER